MTASRQSLAPPVLPAFIAPGASRRCRAELTEGVGVFPTRFGRSSHTARELRHEQFPALFLPVSPRLNRSGDRKPDPGRNIDRPGGEAVGDELRAAEGERVVLPLLAQ